MSQALLDDDAVARFLAEGYLALQPAELGDAFHERMFQAASELYDEGTRVGGDALHLQHYGDNLLARIPQLGALLDCPTVAGALASLLGEGYALHPHHYVHAASERDQGFHQDGNLPWNERGHYRSHRPAWAMLFYYPQQVTEANGPTEVLPGSQYWTRDFERGQGWRRGDPIDPAFNAEAGTGQDLALRDRRLDESLRKFGVADLQRRRLPLPAGSAVLAHYDLFHRGARQHPTCRERRYMYKFYFMRTQEPHRPTWRNRTAKMPAIAGALAATRGIVASHWAWLRGAQPEPDAAPANAAAALTDAAAEDARMQAAYALGFSARTDAAALRALADALRSDVEAVRRASGYALGVAGDAALDTLLNAANDADARVRRIAVFAVGETRSCEPRAAAALAKRLQDEDDLVRSNAASALGCLGRCQPLPRRVVHALLGRLDPKAEGVNTNLGPPHRSTVRESIAGALLQLARNQRLDDAQLQAFATAGLADPDRYVRGLAAEALRGLAHNSAPAWLQALLQLLSRSQFHALDGRGAVL